MKRFSWKTIILVLLLNFPMFSIGQSSNIGHPSIYNYDNKTYKAGTQNWDITQGTNGLMYFANNAGLVVFDGKYWRHYQVSNKTIVRSVEAANNGRIYVGAQGEMGYFSPNQIGELVYTSLNHLLKPQDQTYADVWEIVIVGSDVYFQTGQNIFHYDGKKMEVIYVGHSLSQLSEVDNEIYIYDFQKGILKLKNGAFKPIGNADFFNKNNIEVNGIFAFHQDTLMISTVKNGLLLFTEKEVKTWETNGNRSLKDGTIYLLNAVR